MNPIQAYARSHLANLQGEPLFHTLAGDVPAVRTLQILPYVTFWSMVFQDIIALNLERVTDPTLRAIVQRHHDEDAGHERWLTADLQLIYRSVPDVVGVFDAQYFRVREISYAFMAEVYRAESDWERVTLPILLEEGGKIFLGALIRHFQRVGLGQHLTALGDRHAEAEEAHQLHGEDVAFSLGAVQVPEDALARAMAMIERSRATFARFAEILHTVITGGSPEIERQLRARLQELFSVATTAATRREIASTTSSAACAESEG